MIDERCRFPEVGKWILRNRQIVPTHQFRQRSASAAISSLTE